MQTVTEVFQDFKSVKVFEILTFHPNLGRNTFKTSPVISEQEFIFQKSYSCPQALMMVNLLLGPSDRLKPGRADNHERTQSNHFLERGSNLSSSALVAMSNDSSCDKQMCCISFTSLFSAP